MTPATSFPPPLPVRARDNPFATHRVLRVRYRLQDTTWLALDARLRELNFRAAIVGPEGAGKTTLLEDLQQRFELAGQPTQGFVLRRGERNFSADVLRHVFPHLADDTIILLDGAEQLSRLAWWSFRRRTRHCRGLVITSHRAGLLPTLLLCRTTPELFAEILHELLGPHAAATLHAASRTLFQQQHGNLRDALRELYDLTARGELLPRSPPPVRP